MIDVLHVLPRIAGGGGPRSPRNVSRHLQSQGFSSHTFVSLADGDPQTLRTLNTEGFATLNAPGRHALTERIARADIVQIDWWADPALGALLTTSWPAARVALWSHVYGGGPTQAVSEELAAWPDRLVVCSPLSLALPALAGANAVFIHSPADLQRFGKAERCPSEDGFAIGHVGSLDFSKLHPDFIQMSLDSGIDDARFFVAGTGPDELALARQVESSERGRLFSFLGRVADPASVFARCHIYGYPYAPGSFAGAEQNLQEALFFGLPAVTLAEGGAPWIVRDGETGYVASSPVEYAASLRRLREDHDTRRRMSEAARADANERFRSENSAAEFKRLYSEMMQSPKRRRAPVALCATPSREAGLGSLLLLSSLGDGRDALVQRPDSFEWTLPRARALERYHRFFPEDRQLLRWRAAALRQSGQVDESRRIEARLDSGSPGAPRIEWAADDRPALIWGAGESGGRAREILARRRAPIAGFVDRDAAKRQAPLFGLPVQSPRILDEQSSRRRWRVVLANHAAETLAVELEERGWIEGQDFEILREALRPKSMIAEA